MKGRYVVMAIVIVIVYHYLVPWFIHYREQRDPVLNSSWLNPNK
jgi:hypothetical protein